MDLETASQIMRAILNLTLETESFPDGTNGTLSCGSKYICQTIELPWLDNQPRISCYVGGRYRLMPRFTPEKGKHFEVLDVPGRSAILFHAANDARKELLGCTAPVSRITGHGKGESSRIALAKLVALCYPVFEAGGEVWVDVKRVLNAV
ncbi:DUF5675 family protein [Spirosoma aerolatum]|uniref:DUF5675 family protein n=1 Tax=Spirosoma aerolatum TaxID=1211326 RepID=UPI0015D03839|nr:DUF5675 family protein [Spirosoma aerolatum]